MANNFPEATARPELSAAPKCGKCGYVMCQQFDSRPVNAIADVATPNGKDICYHREPTKALPTSHCLDCGHGDGTDEGGRCRFMFVASDPSQMVDTSPTNRCSHYCPRSIGERIARKHLPFHDYDKPLSKPGRQLAADIDSAIQQVREQWISYSRGLTGDTMGES